jgi:hypothetical protein
MSLPDHELKALAIEFAACMPPTEAEDAWRALRLATAHFNSIDALLARIMEDRGDHVMLAHAARALIEVSRKAATHD